MRTRFRTSSAARRCVEAEAARPAGLQGREDWRELPLVTIDPADAKDHDDAVFAEPDTDSRNAGGFIVMVAIADVAHYVTPGSPLDREALARGNSVYFPDRVVPMLPERISNDLCSLRPQRGSRGARRAHGDRRGRTQAQPHLPPRDDALRRQAQLRAGAGSRRRQSGRDDAPAARPRDRAALRRLCGGQARAQRTPAARPRPARAQDRAEGRRHASTASSSRRGSTRTG